MYYIIYKITNLVNDKVYIGAHTTENINDSYMGSGLLLRRSQKKHGMQNFNKEILHSFSNEKEMYAKEKELVNEEFVSRDDTYNLMTGGFGGGTPSEETKAKIREIRKIQIEQGINVRRVGEYKASEETRKKLSESLKGNVPHNKGKTLSEETKAKIRDARAKQINVRKKGEYKVSEETKQKIRVARAKQIIPCGRVVSEETKAKIRTTRKKQITTEETCRKISEAHKGERNHFYGKHHSEETKQKLRDYWINRKLQSGVK